MHLRSAIALVVATLALVAGASCAARRAPAATVSTPAGVRFLLVDRAARSVALSGTFNQWSISSHPLAREKSPDVWTVIVPLPPGEYLFMYVVDGVRWVTPPLAEEYVDDGFGAKNGVVVVRPIER
jgi:1,4-alpha-glucan branching enzyme